MNGATTEAFLLGLISACSLPLGTLTAMAWRPGERVVGMLMAFGGGALLAALTIDLVGSALDSGEVLALCLGCLLGGLLFLGLNHLVNSQGGFLRKTSTTWQHLHRQRRRRLRQLLGHIRRVPVFEELPRGELALLAAVMQPRRLAAGEVLFRPGEPAGRLYLLTRGQVILDEDGELRRLGPGDGFGGLAFLSGASHTTEARAATPVMLWLLSRERLAGLLPELPVLGESLWDYLQTPGTRTYLQTRHGLSAESVDAWLARALESLATERRLPVLEPDARSGGASVAELSRIARLPLFQGLSDSDLQLLSRHLSPAHHRHGEVLFQQGDPADALYLLESGEVTLIGVGETGGPAETVGEHAALGGLSFVTNAPHTRSAVVTRDVQLWRLSRRDFEALLPAVPALERRVEDFLQDPVINEYLAGRHHLAPNRADAWVRQSLQDLHSGTAPTLTELLASAGHGGAPLAIWLGIFLDGVPESLVIGASLIHAEVGLSLLAGLFLANYPEALSSSVGMRERGMGWGVILLMWTSLMLFTGLGAAAGNRLFVEAAPGWHALIEGLAAGAMLTMIAETMLPEAYLKSGTLVGLATLLGFLAAILFSTL